MSERRTFGVETTKIACPSPRNHDGVRSKSCKANDKQKDAKAKKNLINNQPVLETRSHAEEELRETSKASYPMNHLSYF